MAATDRLIATLAAEVVGYSRLIRADEKGALEQLEAHRDRFVFPKIAEHSGRIVKATGDNLLVEFDSPAEAVRCAVELQSGMIDRNIRVLPDRRITFRVGVAIGEVTGHGDDLVIRAVAALPTEALATLIKPGAEVYEGRGELAMRVAVLAEPGGICISGTVRDTIRDQLPYIFEYIGKQTLEIAAAPVDCYAMNADAVESGARLGAQNLRCRPMRLRRAAVAAGVFATVGVWGIALWAWLGSHSSTALIHAPVTAGSHAPSAGITADGVAPRSSSQQSPLVSSTPPETDPRAPPAPQLPPASGMVADRSMQASSASQPPPASTGAADSRLRALSSRPAPSEIGAVVVRGNEAQSALPSVIQTTANSGAAVIRGRQVPPAPEIAPNGSTDVIRGTRIIPPAPLSSRPDQR
jgi:class 3 adenylate cyclase